MLGISRRSASSTLIALFVTPEAFAQSAASNARNIVFVMADGLRWQELFSGADAMLMTKENGAVADPDTLKKLYWRDSPEARREVLMPFVWSVLARQGQVYGNRRRGSDAYVTNGLNFSYPGYSETLCGFADARIASNDKIPNPNVTVLEWLHRKPAYRSKVAAFGAWDTFPAIINAERAGFPVNAGYDPLTAVPVTPELQVLNQLKEELPRAWPDEVFDAVTFRTAIEYVKARKPRVLYISFGETDEWAHAGQYTEYLDAVHRTDTFVRTLWETLQSMPEYRGTTALIFATDHGRGEAPVEWKNHGEKVPDSKYIWMAFLGPGVPARGERSNVDPVKQSQIAATLAALLGEDYRAETPLAGAPISGVLH